jgi:hypothetical protein
MKDHKANTKHPNGLYTSKVKEHMHSHDHYYTDRNITILDKDTNWLPRGIRESLQIRALNPSINADQGRHKLPYCYDGIIKDRLAPISKRKIQAPKNTANQFRLPPPQTLVTGTDTTTTQVMSQTSNIPATTIQHPDAPPGSNTTQTTPITTSQPPPQPHRKRKCGPFEEDTQNPGDPLPKPKRQRPSTHNMTMRRRAP